MSIAVYQKLWGMTAAYSQRRQYGWYHATMKLAWWLPALSGTTMWYVFPWFSDVWKRRITLGFWEPPLIHWDMALSNYRSEYVKDYLIPYK